MLWACCRASTRPQWEVAPAGAAEGWQRHINPSDTAGSSLVQWEATCWSAGNDVLQHLTQAAAILTQCEAVWHWGEPSDSSGSNLRVAALLEAPVMIVYRRRLFFSFKQSDRRPSVGLQEGLQLAPQQAGKVLTARRCLLEKLRKVGQERRQLLSALGLQLLQTPQDQWAQAPPVQRLQNNLGQERAAVSAFLFSTVDEVSPAPCALHCPAFKAQPRHMTIPPPAPHIPLPPSPPPLVQRLQSDLGQKQLLAPPSSSAQLMR